MAKQKIYYLSALPGVGKTHLAVKIMLRHINRKTGILIYVAPTKDLLDEVRKYLEKDLDKEGSKKIRKIIADQFSDIKTRVVCLLENKPLPDGTKIRKLTGGSVLLMTHQGFLSLPAYLPRKDEMTVIFDEARKFTAELQPIKLTNVKERKMFSDLVSKNSTPLNDVDGKPTGFNKFVLYEMPSNLKDIANSVDGRKQYSHLRKATEAALNRRTDVYVKKQTKTKKYEFYEVTMPSRVFEGFKTVILMAAFLEDSQMWHLFLNSNSIKLEPLWEHPDFESTQFLFDKKIEQIKKRFSRVCIFPLTEQTKPLSMTLMKSAVMVKAQDLKTVKKKLESLGITRLDRLIAIIKRDTLAEPTLNELKALKVLKQYKAKPDPFAWYMKVATTFVETMKQDGKIEDKILTVVNTKGDNSKHVHENYPELTQISPMSHGLNKYAGSNTMIFAAALNPKPTVAKLYRALLPNYNYTMDHLADSCVQSVTRLAVRDVESEVVAYVILPDTATANLLRAKMLDRPIISMRALDKYNRVALNHLNPKRIRELRTKVVKKDDDKVRYAKWLSSDTNRLLASKRTMRSIYLAKQKNGKDVTKQLLKVENEINRLLEVKRIEKIKARAKAVNTR